MPTTFRPASRLSLMALAVALAAPTVAHAQTTPTTSSPDSQGPGATPNNPGQTETQGNAGSGSTGSGAPTGDVVVTGSRIANPNLNSPNPITSFQGQEFFQSGQVSIGDQLNQLPQFAPTFSQSNSTRFLGTSGLNLLDLRGLGTQRTLVLVNGRRHVAGDILNSGTSVDTNTIPTDLIDRVETVTGGESAIYGSDAISGVVNFILKDHFDGLEMRGQSGLSPDYRDGAAQFASVLAGKNFGGGKGNIAANVEYVHQDQYFATSRPYLNSQQAFLQVRQTGTSGSPKLQLFNDVRSASYSETGLIRFGGTPTFNAGLAPNSTAGAPVYYTVPYQFTSDGNLVPVTGQRVGFGPTGSLIGGSGSNFRSGDQFQIQPRLNRVNASIIGHYTIADALEPFVEATYSHTSVFGSGSGGPAFISGLTLGDGDPTVGQANRETYRVDNPFLSAQARSTITANLLAANPAAVVTGATRFSVREILDGLGARAEQSDRNTYRIVGGFRGTFNDGFRYELSANYGEFDEKTKVLGNLNIQRFLLANDATRNAAGQIVCRSQVNAAAAYGYAGVTDPNAAAVLARDVAACVPINTFGGQFTDAQKAYVLSNTTSVGKISQFDVSAFVSGDLHQLFSLPGGPIGFSIGGEYRRETNSFREDPLVQAGYTFYNAIPTFTAPALKVKEAYGELRVPLVKDFFLIKELTVSGAARVSDYNTSAGTVYSYNASGIYKPVEDLQLRASYARAVRAPNLGELYTPFGQNFALVDDPCSADNIGNGTANRAANCAAAGRPAGYNFQYSNSLLFRSGGNAALQSEKSDSYTYGGVLTPHWIRGLSITADYFNIKVRKAIASVDAQTIINQCYDLPTLANQFCALFQRAGTGGGPRGEIPFQILENSLTSGGVNFGLLRARGVDAEVAYNHQLGGFGRLSVRGNYSHVIQRDDFTDPTMPNTITRDRGNLGFPVDRFRINTDLKKGPVTLGYVVRWFGKQYVGDVSFYNSLNGSPPTDPFYADHKYYPVVAYHDVRVGVDASDRFNIYGGVTNVANKKPPLGLTGLDAGSGEYDVLGRFAFIGAVAKF